MFKNQPGTVKENFFFMTTLCCAALVIVLAAILAFTAEKQQMQYPQSMTVIGLDEEADTVYVETFEGLVYTFHGVEDYALGDIVACIMDDAGTPDYVLDDIILKARYAGY